jgi:hypothetical protein
MNLNMQPHAAMPHPAEMAGFKQPHPDHDFESPREAQYTRPAKYNISTADLLKEYDIQKFTDEKDRNYSGHPQMHQAPVSSMFPNKGYDSQPFEEPDQTMFTHNTFGDKHSSGHNTHLHDSLQSGPHYPQGRFQQDPHHQYPSNSHHGSNRRF